jgi:pimeloyl-ACP methyl ester carboxylesterase
VVDDVAGAVAVLRARGVRKVALVGASMGATTALLAGAALRPPVSAVVSLSTGKFDLSMLLGSSSSGLHGWDLLGGANGAGFTPFAAKVASFIGAHAA